jgi:hypothetical protein
MTFFSYLWDSMTLPIQDASLNLDMRDNDLSLLPLLD